MLTFLMGAVAGAFAATYWHPQRDSRGGNGRSCRPVRIRTGRRGAGRRVGPRSHIPLGGRVPAA